MRVVCVAGALVAATMLHSFLARADVGVVLAAATVGIAVAAALEPAWGLLAVAALAPLGASISALAGVRISSTEPLVVAVLLGAAVRAACVRRRSDPVLPPSFRAASGVFIVLVLGSWVGQVAATAAVLQDPQAALRGLGTALWTHYFAGREITARAASLHIEGVALLGLAAAAGSRDSTFGPRLLAALLAGACGAAVLSWDRLLDLAFTTSTPMTTALHALAGSRVVDAFPDPNASGSYFALAAGVAAWFAASRLSRRLAGGLALTLVLFALWLAGSRTAIAAFAVASATVAVAGVRRARAVLVALVVIAVAVAALTAGQLRARHSSPRIAATIRIEFARTTGRMIAEHPLAGVGVGRFKEESGTYNSARLRALYPRENAHNQFFQVLGELGIPGGLAFCAMLAAAWMPVWGLRRARATGFLVAGLLAFMLTWLAGHPLLVVGVGSSFFLALGAAFGMALSPGGEPARGIAFEVNPVERPSRLPGVRSLVAAAVLLVIPAQVWWGWAGPLRTAGAHGVTGWWTDPNGRDYRAATGRAVIVASLESECFELPLRLFTGGAEATVDVALDRVVFLTARLYGSDWSAYTVRVPRRMIGRLVPMEVTARTPDGRDAEVLIGRVNSGVCAAR